MDDCLVKFDLAGSHHTAIPLGCPASVFLFLLQGFVLRMVPDNRSRLKAGLL